MAESTQSRTADRETITFVIYEEVTRTYKVPVQHLREMGLPTTREELSDTTELHLQDIHEDSLTDAVEDLEPYDVSVQERRISFPSD